MRKRLLAAGLGLMVGANGVGAQPQYPQPLPPIPPTQPLPPNPLPSIPPLPPSSFPQYTPGQYTPQPAIPQTRIPQPSFPGAPARPQAAPPGPAAPYVPPAPQFPAPPQATPPALPSLPQPTYPSAPTYPTGPIVPAASTVPQGFQPSGIAGPAPFQPVPRPEAVIPGELRLPYPEQKVAFRAGDVTVKRVVGGWQVWAGAVVLRDLGDNEMNARDVARVFRDQRPTEWVTIGFPKPVVEYGLINGRPAMTGAAPDAKGQQQQPGQMQPNGFTVTSGVGPAPGFGGPVAAGGPAITGAGAKVILPIDLKSARIEQIRGVWCVRDDNSLLFNFGSDKAGAEQATAAIRKYGFNRIGIVGQPGHAVMTYMFVSAEADPPKSPHAQLMFQSQVDGLARTGIPVPGVGFVGEMVKIDPRKVEARREGTTWVVASGNEVIGSFGGTEWAAREAARTLRDGNYTEFCRLGGTSGVTFFLKNGKAPTQGPFTSHTRSFDNRALKVQRINDRWAVTEGNKHLFDVGSADEGETLVRVLTYYGFDQIANLTAGGPKGGIMMLVKTR